MPKRKNSRKNTKSKKPDILYKENKNSLGQSKNIKRDKKSTTLKTYSRISIHKSNIKPNFIRTKKIRKYIKSSKNIQNLLKDNKNKKNTIDDEFQIKVNNDIQTINDNKNNFQLCKIEKSNVIINLETANSNNKINTNNKNQNSDNYSSNEKFKNKKEDEKKEKYTSNKNFLSNKSHESFDKTPLHSDSNDIKKNNNKIFRNQNNSVNCSNSIDSEFEENESSGDSSEEIGDSNYLDDKSIEEKKPIIIKYINNEKNNNISLDKIKKLFRNREYDLLVNYKFPFINQSEFNSKIYPIGLKEIRSLFFYCPLCDGSFRHYSIPSHIFQSHFLHADEYLTQKQIAKSCASILEKEYEKICNSLKIFSEVATIFESCNFVGMSLWRNNARNSINKIKYLNIEEKFFRIALENAKMELSKKMPINKNKNKKRVYKRLEMSLLVK